MEFLDLLLNSILLGVIIVSLLGASRYLSQYRDLSSFRLLLIIFFFNMWTVSRIVFSLNFSLNLLADNNYIYAIRVGNLFLMFSILTIAYLLTNPFFGERARVLAMIGYSIFSGAGVLILFDFFDPVFFRYTIVNDSLEIELHRLLLLLIVTGMIFLTLSYIMALRSIGRLPKPFYSSNLIFQIVTVIVVVGIGIFFVSFFLQTQTDLSIFNYGITYTINAFFMLLFYYFYQQPLIQFNVGLSAKLLVDQNYVGYILGAFTDVGPTVISSSEEFNNKVNIDDEAIITLNIGGTTMLGINESFGEKVAIIPVPGINEFSTIMFSFMDYYEGINDSRLTESTATVFGILVPSALLVNLSNFKKAQQKLQEELQQFESINKLAVGDHLKELTTTILSYLTN